MKKTLLVVEDDARNLRLVRALLSAQGYALLCAHDGQSGVELAMERVPDATSIHVRGRSRSSR